MPSPIGHGLAALVISRFSPSLRAQMARSSGLASWGWIGALVFAANAPDLDFVPGIVVGIPHIYHRVETHNLVAAVAFGVMTGVGARLAGVIWAWRFGALMGVTYASHLFVDLLAADYWPPYGLPIFWPFSNHHVVWPVQIFLEIERSPDASNFFTSMLLAHNADAAIREFAILGLVLAAVWLAQMSRAPRPGDRGRAGGHL